MTRLLQPLHFSLAQLEPTKKRVRLFCSRPWVILGQKSPTGFLPPAKVTYSLKIVAFTSALGLQGTAAVLMNRRQSPEVYSFAIFGVVGVSAENSWWHGSSTAALSGEQGTAATVGSAGSYPNVASEECSCNQTTSFPPAPSSGWGWNSTFISGRTQALNCRNFAVTGN